MEMLQHLVVFIQDQLPLGDMCAFSTHQPFGCANSIAHSELCGLLNLSPCSEWQNDLHKRHTLTHTLRSWSVLQEPAQFYWA